MAAAIAPVLFTEARLNIEPSSPTAVLQISTDNSISLFTSRKKARVFDDGLVQSEEDYARRHLAIESSIYFRQKSRLPRNILWRVLDESKVLELQSVDLTQNRQSAKESLLTFSINFTNPIRPNGVAFADNHSHDALEVFVLTTSNELFTFSFRRDLLLRSTVPSPADFEPSSCFKTSSLSSFSFRHPYKLVALSDLVLAVSLHDGALLRLERSSGEAGSAWRETFFHEGGWGSSLRGLIPWKGQNTVRFGNLDLAAATAVDVAASPSGEHVFTVSLDHTLKAWNSASGKVGFQIDLLGEARPEGRPTNQYLISPGQNTLMRVLDAEKKPAGDAFYCVVYSPKDHQFKFWAVIDPDSAEYGIRDVQPDLKLIPPLDEIMETNVWQLADFDLKPGVGWKDTQLWIRARSGSDCRIFTLTFDLLASSDDIEHAWKHQWVMAGDDYPSVDNTSCDRLLFHSDEVDQSVSVTDEWIEFLTFPGRYTTPLLETALNVYRKGQGLATKSASGNNSFQERFRHAVSAKVGLSRRSDGSVDLTRYADAVNAQCRIFTGLVRHLQKRRSDSLAISFDRETALCWSIRADQVAPIRACSESEVIIFNETIFAEQDDEWILNSFPLAESLPEDLALPAARLLSAAKVFREGLSSSSNRTFDRLASAYALRDAGVDFNHRSRKSHPVPLQQLYERCDFSNEVGDDEYAKLTECVQDLGGLGNLENNVFEAVRERLTDTTRGQETDNALSHYGDKTTIRVAQDTLILGREALLDLLALVTFMSQDLETDELARGFRAMDLYTVITDKLREFDVLFWMASNTRPEIARPSKHGSKDDIHAPKEESGPSMTILESVFIGDWSSMPFPTESYPNLITYWSRAWTFGTNLSIQYDGVTAHVMSNLLKHQNYELAFDFARFLPSNSWTTYLMGQLYLGEGENAAAAASFKKAASDLSQTSSKHVQPLEVVDTAQLLSPTQRQYFNAGTPRFYLHCSLLFEQNKLPSYAADFAELALHELEEQGNETLDSSMMEIDNRKRSMMDSPAAQRVDLAMEEIRLLKTSELKEEVLSRLFNASLQTERYHNAFEALTKSTKPAM